MRVTNPLPTASIYSTWQENIEITSADDGTLVDVGSLSEITLKLQDPDTLLDEMTLYMSTGDITVPSLGIFEWRVDASRMSALPSRFYNVVILLDDGTTIVTLLLGNVSIVE